MISAVIFVALIIFVLWITGTISICGDSYCTAKECKTGCSDCSPGSCLDSVCQPKIGEGCSNSGDCTCDTNQVCGPERQGSNEKGCYDMKCGDNICDIKGENKESCCLDCGCNQGYSCNKEKNECQFLTPELDISVNSFVTKVSASTLYSNRELIDDKGEKHPLVSLNITNNAQNIAKKAVLSLKIGTYTYEQKEELGDLGPGKSKKYDWYPTPSEDVLNIKDNMNALINVVASFEDEHGKVYSSSKSIALEIVGRSNMGAYSSDSQFVTPIESVVRQAVSAAGSFSTRDDAGIQQAARQIWNLLKGLGIDYISDPTLEYRQYPAEVLKTKRGDCDDLATLYVALLESVGVKTALISHPGHMYAAYYDSKYIYPVETTMMTSSFDDASTRGKEEYNEHKSDREIMKVEDDWESKDIKTPGNVGIATTEVSFPLIEVHSSHSAEWKCDSQGRFGCLHYSLVVYCDITFANTGTSQGQKCVDVYTYVDSSKVQTKVVCETVETGGHKETRVTYTDATHANVAFTYRCEVE